MFKLYLTGIETVVILNFIPSSHSFKLYLTGIETRYFAECSDKFVEVQIVPYWN